MSLVAQPLLWGGYRVEFISKVVRGGCSHISVSLQAVYLTTAHVLITHSTFISVKILSEIIIFISVGPASSHLHTTAGNMSLVSKFLTGL